MTQSGRLGNVKLNSASPSMIIDNSFMLPQSQSASILQNTGDPTASEPVGTPPLIPVSNQQKPKSPHRPHLYDRENSPSTSARSFSSAVLQDRKEEPRQIILRSFAPCIAVYASPDAEAFIESKGFDEGFKGLLRPFGERIQGKVVVRDSVGASRSWEDFGIRFVKYENVQYSQKASTSTTPTRVEGSTEVAIPPHGSKPPTSEHGHHITVSVDRVVEHQLRSIGDQSLDMTNVYLESKDEPRTQPGEASPAYLLYLRKLLSSMPFVPYETFSHPVACVIAVSSHSPEPIEVLRQLYAKTSHGGSHDSPSWVGSDYLRYYVLIHDEEKDEITKSTALFDLMKRHFGLNCHLLRLRSSGCIQTDDDSIPIPPCDWLSAGEELAGIWKSGKFVILEIDVSLICLGVAETIETLDKYILESDATSIRSFLREMVTQSIIPFMEGRVVMWNDQVASRRRGISGRFMSMSKRWTGFGSGRGTASAGGAFHPSSSSYDALRGVYPPESSEATLRQLADYAFMLRDWKLAYNTYDILRNDFNNDKAWKYHAAANEMAAASFLLIPQTINLRSRSDIVDQLLEAASYSYLTRCSMPYGIIRCLTITMELFRSRGPTAAQDAARWGGKLLEFGVLTPFAQAFLTERMADYYRARTGAGLLALGSRKRQTAFWSLMSANTWASLGISSRARRRLSEAGLSYGIDTDLGHATMPFLNMRAFWDRTKKMVEHINQNLLTDSDGINASHESHSMINNDSEQLESVSRLVPGIQTMDTGDHFNLGVGGIHQSSTDYTYAQPSNDGFE